MLKWVTRQIRAIFSGTKTEPIVKPSREVVITQYKEKMKRKRQIRDLKYRKSKNVRKA